MRYRRRLSSAAFVLLDRQSATHLYRQPAWSTTIFWVATVMPWLDAHQPRDIRRAVGRGWFRAYTAKACSGLPPCAPSRPNCNAAGLRYSGSSRTSVACVPSAIAMPPSSTMMLRSQRIRNGFLAQILGNPLGVAERTGQRPGWVALEVEPTVLVEVVELAAIGSVHEAGEAERVLDVE